MSNEHKKKKPCNCKADENLKATQEFLKYYGGVQAELGTEPKWKTYLRYYTVRAIAVFCIPFLFIYVVLNIAYNILSGRGKMATLDPIVKLLKHNG